MLVVCSEEEREGRKEGGTTSISEEDGTGERSPSHKQRAVKCAGCGREIFDRYYLFAVERQWHLECLTCCQCKEQLDSEISCFAKEGHIYCRKDYHRLFSAKYCTRCRLSISRSELVMRARDHVYHLHCFTCATCNKALTKGEYFGIREDVIYCKSHYEMLLHCDNPSNLYSETCLKELKQESPLLENKMLQSASADFSTASSLLHPYSPGLQSAAEQQGERPALQKPPQKGRPKKHKAFFPSSLFTPLRGSLLSSPEDLRPISRTYLSPIQQHQTQHPSNSNSITATGSDSSTSSEQHVSIARPKRMRTSFKHHQLRAMKSYFAINHNPDAKDLKQLSQKTGLSKRVLQVWFQNARAKWRRNILRQRIHGPEIAQDSKPLSELTSQPHFCESLRLTSSLIDVQPTQITQEEQNIQTFTNLI